jgi:hypothetical protein
MEIIQFDSRKIREELLNKIEQQAFRDLPPEKFYGAGIYFLYYSGNFDSYQRFIKNPIYVGKAEPKGSRKGIEINSVGAKIFSRLRHHANSISETQNLTTKEFKCKYLLIEDIWIEAAERVMIKHFAPIWNCLIEGFGNNVAGQGRGKQKRSCWDTLHPGRKLSLELPSNSKSIEEIIIEIDTFEQKRNIQTDLFSKETDQIVL